MSEIQQLQPALLWKWFDQICAIPHPSHHEQKIAEFIVNWAQNKGLSVERDEVGNVLIRKPATAGMEDRQTVAIQAHLDMVPQANEATKHDFLTDPILPYVDGDWVKAKGTTLGADNGIGMASALALLDSQDLAHPALEVLLTMTEEAGMDGALGLRANWLHANVMINTDTEEEGEIYIGCAGGEDATISLPIQRESNNFAQAYQLSIKGLRGGHSGCDIHTGRVNAIKLLARFLVQLQQAGCAFNLAEIRGGSIRNAIPREAFATLCFNQGEAELKSAVQNFTDLLSQELAESEPNLSISLQAVEKPNSVFSQDSSAKAIHFLNALPNGVLRNSDVVQGVVETSSSIGVLTTQQDSVQAIILMRSLIESGKQYMQQMLLSVSALCGATAEFSASYPGWAPQPNTDILNLTEQVYAQVLGHQPQIKVIHAGLECGLIKRIYPNMDLVSIGPTIRNAHSPDEKVHIPAVQTYWQLLTQILANMPKQ